ncbi:hypothetical protein [Klebsiella sp. RIT-PI-d]|uniref:hypothetical protein n=1 Tax=Klebsiella sp. RIT-PI-d TaxID=1681196 RepID=UPI001D17AFAE|nr:hypothetical protein [Klebsiella sp. RIT-PI-d]
MDEADTKITRELKNKSFENPIANENINVSIIGSENVKEDAHIPGHHIFSYRGISIHTSLISLTRMSLGGMGC